MGFLDDIAGQFQKLKDRVSPPPSLDGKVAIQQQDLGNPLDGGFPLKIVDGDFSLPKDITDDALKLARSLRESAKKAGIKLEDTVEFRDAARLDGKDGLSDKELAAFLIARSMDKPIKGMIDNGTVETSFGGGISPEEAFGKDRKDPKVVFEMAKQILGDSFHEKVGGMKTTSGPEGDKPYIDAAINSPETLTARC